MTEKKFQTAAEVTSEMISAWEEKYMGKIYPIVVPIDGEIQPKFFIRKPDRVILNQLSRYTAEKDFEKANSTLIKNCVLGGDMQYLEDGSNGGIDEVYYSVLDAIGELVEKKKAIFLK